MAPGGTPKAFAECARASTATVARPGAAKLPWNVVNQLGMASALLPLHVYYLIGAARGAY